MRSREKHKAFERGWYVCGGGSVNLAPTYHLSPSSLFSIYVYIIL